jgi:hypothetical protein
LIRTSKQGGNTNIVVRRDLATDEMTRVLVHRLVPSLR